MQTAERRMPKESALSPMAYRVEDVVVAYLMQHIQNLPKEAMADLVAIGPILAKCTTRDELDDIAETIREIMFPELIGKVNEGVAGSTTPTPNLDKRMEWIGRQIRELRKSQDLTQEQLAEKSGLLQSHISRLEAGQHSPSFKTLEKIAAALGKRVCDIDPAADN